MIGAKHRRKGDRIERGRTNDLAVYDGRACCGFLRPSGSNYVVFDADRKMVGVFPNVRAAVAAIGGAP
jgi:hypothetical protein